MDKVIEDLIEFSDKYNIPLNHAIFFLRSFVLIKLLDDKEFQKLMEEVMINGSKTMYS